MTARAAYLTLALACLLFAAYGSLLPFEFEWTSFDVAWRRFRATLLYNRPRRISRSDVLANALLFVPIGFALAGALLVDRQGRWRLARAAVLILPFSIAVSVAIEFFQVFAPGRIPSSADIAAQTAGCFVGICLWAAAGDRLTRWLRETLATAPAGRLPRLLTAYVFGWIFINLAPFDITVDVGDLAARVRTGKIALVPFGEGVASARSAWDALAEFLGAAPLGLFGLLGWTGARPHRRPTAFAIGFGIAAGVEVAQIFIRSHAATSTDLVFASAGLGLGVAIGPRLLARHHLPSSDGPPPRVHRLALAALAAWILVLCAYHWVPYDFVVDTDAIRRKLGRMSPLPFAGYRGGSYLNALNNLLTKTALALPLGVAAAYAVRPGAMPWGPLVAGCVLCGLVVFGTIEAGQFFLPGRFPDPTDVLVGTVAMVAGLRLGAWLRETR